ncbi:hypothetical protein KDN24_04055 [Bacillus sp. Bva_UNVM-123]|uniref:hypothetical protein n=1 Tax=Bacillus sp. Bva_UNVM-123 TaxID=2829798 RepID=UPI00391F40E7
MKKKLIISLSAFIFISLIPIAYLAISPKDSPKEQQTNQPVGKIKEVEEIMTVDDYGGTYLTEAGQNVRQNDWGTFTLLHLYKINQTFDILPMKLTIHEIKVINLSKMTEQTKEYLQSFTGLDQTEIFQLYSDENLSYEEIEDRVSLSRKEIDKDITYYEISYSVENTSSKELQFFSMQTASFNNNMIYDVPEKNFIYSEDTLMGTKSVSRVDYEPNEERKGVLALLNESATSMNKLSSFTFTTDDIRDGGSHDLLVDGKTFHIEFD